jgi:protease-4
VSRGVVEVFRSISGASHAGEPHISVVRAVGGITMGGGSPFGGSGITERDLGRTLNRLIRDDMAKAVVLRIDSPGGSALASDLLWKRLMKLRAAKPLIVSVGGMAASGGYYLACTANKILAEPTSIVGSIGVVGGKLSFGRALDEIGVHAETIAASPDPGKAARAAYMSPFVPWDDATRARMLASMTAVYDLFLRRVAEGRGLPKEKIAASAEGRIFAGTDAKDRGLVDELGGLDRAIEVARESAKLPKDTPVTVVSEGASFIDLLGGGDDEEEADERSPVERAAAEAGARVADAWLDAVPEIRPFLASAEPLANGERTLTALPFVVVVR